MGMKTRIIPRMDIKGTNLVKGIHLEGLRVLGKPRYFARYYYESGADELLYVDTVASLYQRNTLLDIVTKTAKEIFIPLTVSGGLRGLSDIKKALRAGADKIALNTAALQRPEIVQEASQQFGSSTITVSIEAKKRPDGRYECYTDNGRNKTGIDAFDWAARAVEMGAGELLITSIDQEGTGKGFDLTLIKEIAQSVPVPVIACGGGGSMGHVLDVIEQGFADAVSVASILHYRFAREHMRALDSFTEGNLNFLKRSAVSSTMEECDLVQLKAFLKKKGIYCREPLGSQCGPSFA